MPRSFHTRDYITGGARVQPERRPDGKTPSGGRTGDRTEGVSVILIRS